MAFALVAVLVIGMGCRHNVTDPIFRGHPRHLQCGFPSRWTVICGGQDVAMDVDHRRTGKTTNTDKACDSLAPAATVRTQYVPRRLAIQCVRMTRRDLELPRTLRRYRCRTVEAAGRRFARRSSQV